MSWIFSEYVSSLLAHKCNKIYKRIHQLISTKKYNSILYIKVGKTKINLYGSIREINAWHCHERFSGFFKLHRQVETLFIRLRNRHLYLKNKSKTLTDFLEVIYSKSMSKSRNEPHRALGASVTLLAIL